jgi:hypothetical protein
MSSTEVSSAGPHTDESCDVIVIGGGPAGATAAALLAQQGRKVVLLEKAHHPRFHIGESLLPANVELFDKLGVRDQVEKIGMPKFGIEFVSPEHEHRSYVDFAEGWDKSLDSAWQVRRSELDEMLFRNAATRGAQPSKAARCATWRSTPTARPCRPRWTTAPSATGAPVSWSMPPAATRSGQQIPLQGKEPRPQQHGASSATSRTPSGWRARRKATSASAGFRTAGSGSFRWPTAPPAWARSAGRTT